MENKVRNAFEQIQAQESLKQNTKAYIHGQLASCQEREPAAESLLSTKRNSSERTVGKGKLRGTVRKYAMAAAVCLVVLLGGGCYGYYQPVAVVSIDINPSVELSINRFDRVVRAEGCNEDGQMILSGLRLQHQKCEEAVAMVLDTEKVRTCLAEGLDLDINVACGSSQRGEQLRQRICRGSSLDPDDVTCSPERGHGQGQGNGHGQGGGKGEQSGNGFGNGSGNGSGRAN